MYRTRLFSLLAGAALVTSMLTVAAGTALADEGRAPGPITPLAPCYALVREYLGTVLPSSWRGYDEESVCQHASQDLTAGAAKAFPVAVQRGPAVSPVDRSECFRELREDLGTVLPGHNSGLTATEICAAAPQAQAASR